MHTAASVSGIQKGETLPSISCSSDIPCNNSGIPAVLGPFGLAGVLPGGPESFQINQFYSRLVPVLLGYKVVCPRTPPPWGVQILLNRIQPKLILNIVHFYYQ